MGDTSGSPLMEVTKPKTKLQVGTCMNIQQEDAITLPTEADKFPVDEKPAIGQAANWKASDMKAEHSDHYPSELTACTVWFLA